MVGGSVEKGELGVQLGSWRRYHESGEDENRSDVQRTRESVVFFFKVVLIVFFLRYRIHCPNQRTMRERDKT